MNHRVYPNHPLPVNTFDKKLKQFIKQQQNPYPLIKYLFIIKSNQAKSVSSLKPDPRGKMDKEIKRDKKKIDKMMDTLIKKDIPRDKALKKCKEKKK